MDWVYLIAQGIGVVGITIGLSSRWSRDRRTTVIRSSVASGLNGIQYAMMGLNGTAAIAAVHVLRGLMLYRDDAGSWMRSRLAVAGMLIVYWAAYAAFSGVPTTWFGWLPILASTASTIALSMNDVLRVKAVGIVGTSMWCVYEAMVGSYGLLWGELIGLGLTIASLTIIVKERRAAAASDQTHDPGAEHSAHR